MRVRKYLKGTGAGLGNIWGTEFLRCVFFIKKILVTLLTSKAESAVVEGGMW